MRLIYTRERERERKCVCVCVCVRERERERGNKRERKYSCMHNLQYRAVPTYMINVLPNKLSRKTYLPFLLCNLVALLYKLSPFLPPANFFVIRARFELNTMSHPASFSLEYFCEFLKRFGK